MGFPCCQGRVPLCKQEFHEPAATGPLLARRARAHHFFAEGMVCGARGRVRLGKPDLLG